MTHFWPGSSRDTNVKLPSFPWSSAPSVSLTAGSSVLVPALSQAAVASRWLVPVFPASRSKPFSRARQNGPLPAASVGSTPSCPCLFLTPPPCMQSPLRCSMLLMKPSLIVGLPVKLELPESGAIFTSFSGASSGRSSTLHR